MKRTILFAAVCLATGISCSVAGTNETNNNEEIDGSSSSSSRHINRTIPSLPGSEPSPDAGTQDEPDSSPQDNPDSSPHSEPDTNPQDEPDTDLQDEPDTNPQDEPDTRDTCVPQDEICDGEDNDCDGIPDNADESLLCTNGGSCIRGRCIPSPAIQLAAGATHTCLLRDNGHVACWGAPGAAIGTGTSNSTPATVPGITNAIDIAAGGKSGSGHTCVILEDHTVRCWGNNNWGQLGNGETGISLSPVVAEGITTATSITAGDQHTCATANHDRFKMVQCWGNGWGTTPGWIFGFDQVEQIDAFHERTCARMSNYELMCWNRGEYPSLGGVAGIDFELGENHYCQAHGPAGYGVTCLGNNTYNQLTVGIPGRPPIAGVSTGENHSCLLTNEGHVWCNGRNHRGQLGSGDTEAYGEPIQALTGLDTPLSDVIQVECGDNHTCALTSSGRVWCWGDNSNGQLGINAGVYVTRPTEVNVY